MTCLAKKLARVMDWLLYTYPAIINVVGTFFILCFCINFFIGIPICLEEEDIFTLAVKAIFYSYVLIGCATLFIFVNFCFSEMIWKIEFNTNDWRSQFSYRLEGVYEGSKVHAKNDWLMDILIFILMIFLTVRIAVIAIGIIIFVILTGNVYYQLVIGSMCYLFLILIFIYRKWQGRREYWKRIEDSWPWRLVIRVVCFIVNKLRIFLGFFSAFFVTVLILYLWDISIKEFIENTTTAITVLLVSVVVGPILAFFIDYFFLRSESMKKRIKRLKTYCKRLTVK